MRWSHSCWSFPSNRSTINHVLWCFHCFLFYELKGSHLDRWAFNSASSSLVILNIAGDGACIAPVGFRRGQLFLIWLIWLQWKQMRSPCAPAYNLGCNFIRDKIPPVFCSVVEIFLCIPELYVGWARTSVEASFYVVDPPHCKHWIHGTLKLGGFGGIELHIRHLLLPRRGSSSNDNSGCCSGDAATTEYHSSNITISSVLIDQKISGIISLTEAWSWSF